MPFYFRWLCSFSSSFLLPFYLLPNTYLVFLPSSSSSSLIWKSTAMACATRPHILDPGRHSESWSFMSHHKLPAIVTSRHCLLPRPKSATTTQITKEEIKHVESIKSPRRPRMNSFFNYNAVEDAAQDRLLKFAGVVPSVSSSAILVRSNDHERQRRRVSSQSNITDGPRRMSTGNNHLPSMPENVPVFSVNIHDYELHSPIGRCFKNEDDGFYRF
jgi:hypothetical protein